jgi:hypothetical protein
LKTAVFRRSVQADRCLLLTIEKIPCRAVNKFIQWIDLLTDPEAAAILGGLGTTRRQL